MKFIGANVEHSSKMLFNTNNIGKNFIFNKTIPEISLEDNLLVYWNFSTIPTPTFQASSYTVQQQGTVLYTPTGGPNNQQWARFPGSTNRVLLKSNLWNHNSGPYTSFTCSAWVRKRFVLNEDGQQGILMGSCFGPMGFYLQQLAAPFGNIPPGLDANNNLTMTIQIQNASYNVSRAIWEYNWPLDQWIHCVMVNDYPSKTIKLYVDNQLRATGSYPSLGSYYPNWNGLALNGSVTSTSAEYGGNYDFAYVALWNRALNENSISSLYNNPSILNT